MGTPADKQDGACSHYRVYWPLEALARTGFADTYVPPVVRGTRIVSLNFDGKSDPNDRSCVNNYDAVVFQRQPEMDVAALIRECRKFGIKTIFDIDDSAATVPKWNPNFLVWGRDKSYIRRMATAYQRAGYIHPYLQGKTPDEIAEAAPKILRGLLDNIRNADMVTTTTKALRDEYSRYNPNIWVLPNQMQPDHWDQIKPVPHPDEIWIGWAGGWTHEKDLALLRSVLRTVLSRYEHVRLVLIGFEQAKVLVFKDLPSEQMITFPWHDDFKGYHSAVASLDIVLAPSVACPFNEGKSDIRIMEGWLCKLPCIGSPTTYGHTIKESKGGFVANKNKDWLKALNRLITQPDLRQEMGRAGYRYVMQRRTYDKNVHLWQNAYQTLFA